ncbi:MAG TPA: hypothetical protein VFZ27_04490 [Terriglobia bacterium]|nr:hypothetical protein [Terriglobia bacterium]
MSARHGVGSAWTRANQTRPAGFDLPGIAFNVAGLLCYILWPVAPIFFLLVGPYNRNRFVRFHAFQSAFLWLVGIGVAIALQIVTSILGLIPVLGWVASGLMWTTFSLIFLILVITLMYKAYNGEWYGAPMIGDFARQQAEKLS